MFTPSTHRWADYSTDLPGSSAVFGSTAYSFIFKWHPGVSGFIYTSLLPYDYGPNLILHLYLITVILIIMHHYFKLCCVTSPTGHQLLVFVNKLNFLVKCFL